ncbi:MAG: NAD(P)-dependent oxidoreductase [Flavobacteriales bacterium]|nr:NAD(P)-dependent oxidoreductase [Flavobacteriales bacterium]
MKIGIIKEGKTPPDKRVPLSPEQCERILNDYDDVEIYVQKSNIRKFSDRDYERLGIAVVDDVSHCDILMGVKEVPVDELIPNKKYLFFSHTFKEQPYNRKLLQAIIDKNIQLIDWEVITNSKGQRLIAFGRYAGIVGCYNGFLAYGLKSGLYNLKPAHQCEDRAEMEDQLPNIKLPNNFKAVITGKGRVGGGALEVIEKIAIKEVSPTAFLTETFNEPVYTVLDVADYYERDDMQPMNKQEFYQNPKGYHSVFPKYAKVANMYIACHYWDSESPFIFTREDAKSKDFNIEIVADISCDIDCAVASTLEPSTIAEPLYGYDPVTESVVDFNKEGAIGVMAVDNLPCELPKDASESFGEMFIEHVLEPLLGNDPENIIERASETKNGKLTTHFSYLEDYLKG